MNTAATVPSEDQATTVRFFDLSSRIGRVRYLAYGWALTLPMLPFVFAGFYLILHGSQLLGSVIMLVVWVFTIPIHFTFMIRRLHDLDRSGWWCLIYAVGIPSSCIRFLDRLQHIQPSPLHLLVQLVIFGFLLMLLFTPGTAGSNRFGPEPPPNSPGVIALAWSMLTLPILVIVGVFLLLSRSAGFVD